MNYVFDCGRVLYDFHLKDILKHFLSDDKDIDVMCAAMKKDWVKLDADEITQSEYDARLRESLPDRLKDVAGLIMRRWFYYMPEITECTAIVKELKARNKPLYLLSNMHKRFVENVSLFKTLEYFDGKVFSCDIKIIKPDKEAFLYLFKKYSLKPEESVFIDDNEENIATAKNLGMKTFLFSYNPKELKQYLLSLE